MWDSGMTDAVGITLLVLVVPAAAFFIGVAVGKDSDNDPKS